MDLLGEKVQQIVLIGTATLQETVGVTENTIVITQGVPRLLCLALVVGIARIGTAAPQEPATSPGEVRAGLAASTEYRVNPSDVLDLDFRFTPELNQSVTVKPDGLIALVAVGELQAAGLTIPELTRSLERAYGSLLRSPLISVSLKDFKKPYFVVDGEVGRPGQYELRGAITLSEAIAVAGGFKEGAKHSEVLMFHRMPDGTTQARQIDVKQMLSDGNLDEDPRVAPSDVIFVPRSTWSKVQRFIPIPGLGIFPFR